MLAVLNFLNYFGIDKLTLDHTIPINKVNNGFIYDIEDVEPMCKSCNSSKSDKILEVKQMFELIKKAQLEIKYFLKRRALEKQKDRDWKMLRNRKQFEIDKVELTQEVQLEELRADVRKEQQKALPKAGQQVQKKSAFAGFLDYAENFAKQQDA
ncbi:MAG: HNH endonuclease, partial [Candidatus Dadabacteria bacterium]|nr:HNH endonuclease [Candidatus Dadabacteria bacterium]